MTTSAPARDFFDTLKSSPFGELFYINPAGKYLQFVIIVV